MRRSFVILLLLIAPAVSQAEIRICPSLPMLPPGADDLRFDEDDFSVDRALEATRFLRNDFGNRIWGPSPAEDLRDASRHQIAFSNSLKLIEGYLLKRRYLDAEFVAGVVRRKDPESPSLVALDSEWTSARADFCSFLAEGFSD